ncbi:VTT domain-containing protein, partial [Cellulomonas sp.]|uniref:VTT domain-containing protein n=1 Tax=Cellulomonas sp. TaxID=40001 RepID=UPI002D750CA5
MPASAALVSLVPALGAQPALLPDWLDAEHLISSFGSYALIGIVVVVFIETGLLFPLLPGDSLLFTAGALVAQDALDFPLWLLCVLLFAAAFLGDQVAYFIGNKVGPRLFRRPDSKIFKQQYIDQTYAYFDKYGGRTVILARFVPIVRTYAPVAAGVGGMRYRTFVSYNVVGALLWGVGVTVLGYLLGTISFVRDNIEA